MDISDVTRWNLFVQDAFSKEPSSMFGSFKIAALVLYYDSEVNNGGHSAFFDCYPDICQYDMVSALRSVGANSYASNCEKAYRIGWLDDYIEVDTIFASYMPTLHEYLMKYVLSEL